MSFIIWRYTLREELELIVIGDDQVRDNVYNSMRSSVQERNREAREVPFPSIFNENDKTISLGSGTHATFTLGDKRIEYGIHKYTNHVDSLNSFSASPYLLKEYLTVVVCINANETGLSIDRFNTKINQLKNIRGNKPFNIIPMIITNNSDAHNTDAHNTDQIGALKKTYPQLCRNIIVIDSNDLNNPEYTQHLCMTLNITLATSLYNEVQNCIKLLHELDQSPTETPAPFDMAPILNILHPALSMIGSTHINTMDSLRAYFNDNRENLQAAFGHLKNDLNHLGVRNQTYVGRIFLNILCSIAAIFASLTIVGIPFVYYALSQNSRYHNNCLKFFATNNIDADRASIVKVEDEMNRTVLRAH